MFLHYEETPSPKELIEELIGAYNIKDEFMSITVGSMAANRQI